MVISGVKHWHVIIRLGGAHLFNVFIAMGNLLSWKIGPMSPYCVNLQLNECVIMIDLVAWVLMMQTFPCQSTYWELFALFCFVINALEKVYEFCYHLWNCEFVPMKKRKSHIWNGISSPYLCNVKLLKKPKSWWSFVIASLDRLQSYIF